MSYNRKNKHRANTLATDTGKTGRYKPRVEKMEIRHR